MLIPLGTETDIDSSFNHHDVTTAENIKASAEDFLARNPAFLEELRRIHFGDSTEPVGIPGRMTMAILPNSVVISIRGETPFTEEISAFRPFISCTLSANRRLVGHSANRFRCVVAQITDADVFEFVMSPWFRRAIRGKLPVRTKTLKVEFVENHEHLAQDDSFDYLYYDDEGKIHQRDDFETILYIAAGVLGLITTRRADTSVNNRYNDIDRHSQPPRYEPFAVLDV